ncbi:AAA family ATPase [Streptomyces sp. H27-D2]|uniref:AAA family ATPase n=1 Tax=Streptomyces sp. H27-D2 TaxID=3046304 RepID=UPI002DBDADB1|nr:AAA family ATPase [Streptomyces sp. H27-D2]MEC4018357.1 AAA family ATPase [Streptomyces sp. H27-D2]
MNASERSGGPTGAAAQERAGPPARDGLLYRGTGEVLPDVPYEERDWPEGPRWRTFSGGPCQPRPPEDGEPDRRLGPVGAVRRPSAAEVRLVNAALLLRRPLLVTGRPGVGKSGLAYRIARELRLGRVLQWPVTSRTTLASGLFEYDVIGRAQAGQAWYAAQRAEAAAGTGAAGAVEEGTGEERALEARPVEARAEIGDFVQLGPLGTALLPHRLPRVLLIDELDKGDADLPNDLLTLFEDGWYAVPPLVRVKHQTPRAVVHTSDPGKIAPVVEGIVRTRAFPIVIMTSNGEREFPEAFMRRCLRLDMRDPDAEALGELVAAHFSDRLGDSQRKLIGDFMTRSEQADGLAADQLLNAAHLATSGAYAFGEGDSTEWQAVLRAIWHPLNSDGAGRGD